MNTNDPNRDRLDRVKGDPANRDPITGAPGAHPVGTGLGAAGAGAAGAAIGAVAGPIGAVAGAAIGAIAGGLAGKAAGEALDPTVVDTEDAYWRANYRARPYSSGMDYDEDLRPAYSYGWEHASRNQGRSFDEASSDLERGWDTAKGKSRMTWDRAKDAVRDSWERITPGRGRDSAARS